jgi:cytochrome c553
MRLISKLGICALLVVPIFLSDIALADADAGKTIVMDGGSNGAMACVACHGAEGAGNAQAGFPRLDGLDADYMTRQLEAFRAEQDPLLQEGEALALRGDWDRDLPACISCHGPGGRGVDEHFPALAGQHASYIAAQIQAWKNGTRRNDPLNLMKTIADRLSEHEIKAVAVYFSQSPSIAE